MRLSKVMLCLALSVALSPAVGADQMFGKNAAMRNIAGTVTGSGKSAWGERYVIVKDSATGLRVYVQTDAVACAPGKPFNATGHLTREQKADFDATFHAHLETIKRACQ